MSGNEREVATLGGGCFWCMEAVYKRIDGVVSVVSGYAGGHTERPSYEEVCSGTTGHAEVVQVEFDPSVIGYDQILRTFFKAHDPTTPNRQGADVGTQYRSVIYYHDDRQAEIAGAVKNAMSGVFRDPVVTQVEPLTEFFPAEDYHQDYFDRNPTAGYCRVVIAPKLGKLGMSKQPLAD